MWDGEEIAAKTEADSPIFVDPCWDGSCTAIPAFSERGGSTTAAPAGPPVARILFRDRATFWKVLLDPDLQFGDAYGDGRLDVEGDLVALLGGDSSRPRRRRDSRAARSFGLLGWLHRARANTPAGARENIHHHYDIGDDFYQLGSTGRWSTAGPISPIRP